MWNADEFPNYNLTVLREESADLAKADLMHDFGHGLSQSHKRTSFSSLFDDRGCELFEKIMGFEKFYLTSSEQHIFEKQSQEIASSHFEDRSQFPINIVDLGAGDGRKTVFLLRQLMEKGVNFEYFPVDIAIKSVIHTFQAVKSKFASCPFPVHGIAGEYFESLSFITSKYSSRRCAVLFLGNSFGVIPADETVKFLTDLRNSLRPRDFVFFGVDALNNPWEKLSAYEDIDGVVHNFLWNLLARMNREIGTDFDTSKFRHIVLYNPRSMAFEDYLLSSEAHTVTMCNKLDRNGRCSSKEYQKTVEFEEYEGILMSCARMFSEKMMQNLYKKSGFHMIANYKDDRGWFLLSVAQVRAD